MVAVLGVVRSRGKRKRDAVGQPLTERKEPVIDTIQQKGREIILPAFSALTASEIEGAGASCSCWVSRERLGQSPIEWS